MDSRRKEPRRAYLAKAVLTYLDELGVEIAAPGMIEDRSKFGLGIRVITSIPVGCFVNITLGGQRYSGVVKRCSSCKPEPGFKGEYFLGIAIEST